MICGFFLLGNHLNLTLRLCQIGLIKKLKKFPYLQKHTKNFLSFLHTQTSTFNGTQQSLYDILISCVITDWIMAALQKYEKQYRIKEFRTVLHPQTTEKDSPE